MQKFTKDLVFEGASIPKELAPSYIVHIEARNKGLAVVPHADYWEIVAPLHAFKPEPEAVAPTPVAAPVTPEPEPAPPVVVAVAEPEAVEVVTETPPAPVAKPKPSIALRKLAEALRAAIDAYALDPTPETYAELMEAERALSDATPDYVYPLLKTRADICIDDWQTRVGGAEE